MVINNERVYLAWKARRKRRAVNGFAASPEFAVAQIFRIPCAEVRRIVQQVRDERRNAR